MKVTEITPILCQGGIKTWTFVKVSTDKGITGWGDATEWVRAQGHVQAMRDLSELVIDEDPFNVEKLWYKMWIASYVGGKDCNVAMTGIETALWDIVGKALNTPVYNLLGGKCHDRVRFYADYCDAYGSGFGRLKTVGGPETRGRTNRWREGDTSPDGLRKQAAYIQEQGFTALKCHPIGLATRPAITRVIGLQAVDDTVAKIATIREAVGSAVDICIDVNNRLDLTSSIALAKALEPYRILFLEDPIRQDESPGSYKRLVDATSTPIGTGENLYTVWSFRNYLEAGGLDVVLPDICHTGIVQAKKIAALAETYHVPVAPHNPNSPLSTVISGHLCASIPNHLALEYDLEEMEPPWRDDITSPPLSDLVRDGHLELPTGPGWGVELDEEAIAEHPYREVWYSGVGTDRRDFTL